MNTRSKWIEVEISGCTELLQCCGNFLFERGCCGLEEEEGGIKGYFAEDEIPEGLEDELRDYIRRLKGLGLSCNRIALKEVAARDWSDEWRKYFKPIRVTPHIIVKPPWEEWKEQGSEMVIEIMPRMAFGTGTHNTTRICLKFLEKYLKPSARVMDLGAGSGILAITALKLGAESVVAVDIDRDAVENCRENLELNGIDKEVEVVHGSLDVIGDLSFDLVAANINSRVLIDYAFRLRKNLKQDGLLIASGILLSELKMVEKRFLSSGYTVEEVDSIGEWIGIVMRRGETK